MQEQSSIDIINGLIQSIDNWGRQLYKSRLLIGEGNFSFTESLICDNEHLNKYPLLAASIIATELEDEKTLKKNSEVEKRLNSLKEKGVTS